MGIFGNILTDDIIQVNDKLRIDCRRSYVSKGEAAISLIEIDPENTGNWIDITGSSSDDWFLDWQFTTDVGTPYAIQLRITTDGLPVVFTKDIEVINEADDYLFSNDEDLTAIEQDILHFLPVYRNSFKYVHRRVQAIVLDELDNMGYTDKNGNRFVKADLIDRQEVKEWSVYKALYMIYNSISNVPNDDFSIKSKEYESKEHSHKNRLFLRIDYDKDGVLDDGEHFAFSTITVGR